MDFDRSLRSTSSSTWLHIAPLTMLDKQRVRVNTQKTAKVGEIRRKLAICKNILKLTTLTCSFIRWDFFIWHNCIMILCIYQSLNLEPWFNRGIHWATLRSHSCLMWHATYRWVPFFVDASWLRQLVSLADLPSILRGSGFQEGTRSPGPLLKPGTSQYTGQVGQGYKLA